MTEKNDRGLTLVVKRAELKAMMAVRAKAHEERVKVHEVRMEQLAKLMRTGTDAMMPAVAAMMPAVAQTVAMAVDEEADGSHVPFIDLSNSSVRDLNSHITYARDRARAHRTAALWLRFAAKHLARDSYTFNPDDDSLLAYLVDVDHPTAMPSYRLIERGVQ